MTLYYRTLFPNLERFQQLEDIEKVVPYMYLSNQIENNVPIEQQQQQILEKNIDESQNNVICKIPQEVVKQSIIYPKQSDSLFWCVYIARYGYEAYTKIGHRYGNTEIEEKQRIIELMRASPNKIKDCPKRITKSQYQEIMSDFMTNKKMTTTMLIIVAIYYNLRFCIVNVGNSGEPETWYMDIYGSSRDVGGLCPTTSRAYEVGQSSNSYDDFEYDPIIIYCKNNNNYYYYGIERSVGYAKHCRDCSKIEKREQSKYLNIKENLFRFDNYDTPLKAISNYKTTDLENIAEKLGIVIERKWKKQDIYNNILQKII